MLSHLAQLMPQASKFQVPPWQAKPAKAPALSSSCMSVVHPACLLFTKLGLLKDEGGTFYPVFTPPPSITPATW